MDFYKIAILPHTFFFFFFLDREKKYMELITNK